MRQACNPSTSARKLLLRPNPRIQVASILSDMNYWKERFVKRDVVHSDRREAVTRDPARVHWCECLPAVFPAHITAGTGRSEKSSFALCDESLVTQDSEPTGSYGSMPPSHVIPGNQSGHRFLTTARATCGAQWRMQTWSNHQMYLLLQVALTQALCAFDDGALTPVVRPSSRVTRSRRQSYGMQPSPPPICARAAPPRALVRTRRPNESCVPTVRGRARAPPPPPR